MGGTWRRAALWAGMLLALATAPARADELYQYYLHKFTPAQNAVYDRAVEGVFAEAAPDERTQARQESQAYSYVVYHRTRWHDVRNNVALTHQYAADIERACHRYGVPVPMALGILSWENSGSTTAMSGAACAGMGQMSDGAMAESHFYANMMSAWHGLAWHLTGVVRATADAVRAPGLSRWASRLAQQELAAADAWHTTARHRRLAHKVGVKDERMLASANIEDSVIFMRLLLNAYDGRADIAISAYHNGLRNTDDLLHDYLRRVDPADAGFTFVDRAPLMKALRNRHISYLTLWNDRRSREMLNGLRTMDGDVTNPSNRSEALGDESDIYVWKVTSALAAWMATPDEVADLEARFDGSQERAETAGLTVHGPLSVVGKGVKVVPELAGYLGRLQKRLQAVAGRKARVAVFPAAHAGRLAVDVTSSLSAPVLGSLLNEDWLFDRIYLSRGAQGRWHICLNPRYGREYLTLSKTSLR